MENLWKTPAPDLLPEFSTSFPQVFHSFSTSFPQVAKIQVVVLGLPDLLFYETADLWKIYGTSVKILEYY